MCDGDGGGGSGGMCCILWVSSVLVMIRMKPVHVLLVAFADMSTLCENELCIVTLWF